MKQLAIIVALFLLAVPCKAQLSLDRLPPQIPLQPVEQIGFGGQYSIAPMPFSEGMTCRERTYLGALIGLTYFTVAPDQSSTNGYRPGMMLSLMGLYELNANMILLATLGLTQMGYSYTFQDYANRYRMNYLTISLLYGYLFHLQSVQLGFLVGPNIGYWMGGNYLFINKVTGDRERQKEEFYESSSSEYHRLMFALTTGVLLRTNCGPGTFLATAMFMYGLNPFTSFAGSDISRQSAGFLLGIGYAIALTQLMGNQNAGIK